MVYINYSGFLDLFFFFFVDRNHFRSSDEEEEGEDYHYDYDDWKSKRNPKFYNDYVYEEGENEDE